MFEHDGVFHVFFAPNSIHPALFARASELSTADSAIQLTKRQLCHFMSSKDQYSDRIGSRLVREPRWARSIGIGSG